jgi:hypothetical protein
VEPDKASKSALRPLREWFVIDWAEAITNHEQVSPGVWDWWVQWNDGTTIRKELFRAQRQDEARCEASRADGSVCYLPVGHTGPHVPTAAREAAIGIILAP